ncbi:MAG: hypothetical protein ACR2G7_10025 [Acidimicrobiales bacterium]
MEPAGERVQDEAEVLQGDDAEEGLVALLAEDDWGVGSALGQLTTMGSLLQIRDAPDDVRRALKARAAACEQSLNTHLLHLLEREGARPTVGDVLDRAAQRAERASVSAVDMLDAARAERDGEMRARTRT